MHRSRRLDIANERLPEFNYTPTSFPHVAVPSMRQPLNAHFGNNWGGGSGSTTPTGEGEGGTPEPSPGAGADVPGAWPTPVPMEEMIKRRLDGEEDDGGYVERMAERLAHGSRRASPSPSGADRPRALKRHETA